jgi:hypothetical protein
MRGLGAQDGGDLVRAALKVQGLQHEDADQEQRHLGREQPGLGTAGQQQPGLAADDDLPDAQHQIGDHRSDGSDPY